MFKKSWFKKLNMEFNGIIDTINNDVITINVYNKSIGIKLDYTDNKYYLYMVNGYKCFNHKYINTINGLYKKIMIYISDLFYDVEHGLIDI